MKKSVLSALTPRILSKKSKGAKKSSGTTKVATSSPGKIASAEASRNKTSHVAKNVPTAAPPLSTSLPTLKKRNFVEDADPKHGKGKLQHEASYRERSLVDDNKNSNSSSEEDVEYDQEALTKLLERKIEQAPAAKVIVSDAMMSGALGEINARKSAISTTAKSSVQSMLTPSTSFSSCASRNRDTTTSVSAVSVLSLPSTSKIIGVPVNGGGGGDAISALNQGIRGDGDDYDGCPLEKVLEFLQAVMTKDYKRALVLANEVEQHEPTNELVLEYKAVLQKIVSKEDEDEESSASSASDSSSEIEFSEDLSTSSETDSVSEDEDEDSESSTESHSSATVVTAGERKSDEDEEAWNDHDELEMTQSMDNKNGENVTSQNKEDVKAAESLHEEVEDNGTKMSNAGGGDLPNNGEVENGGCDVEQVHENNVEEDVSAAEVETKDL